ncbi:acylphosphatase [Paracoccus sp. (in: a-proteobacteria)]|uniref:acylphosphatase n=1 Tax=Paracoccus sp. TaxID=267 RepID=UPI003A8452EF
MTTERFILTGQLAAETLVPWLLRHAGKLGLATRILDRQGASLTMEIAGPPVLLDAMEMGCLLGPIEVWVDEVARVPIPRGNTSRRPGAIS